MEVRTVEQAHEQGYDLFHYPSGTASAKQRAKFEELGTYQCVEFTVEYLSHNFKVFYLGIKRVGQPTRKERGLA